MAESLSYSTTEQFTGAYWIDGKPIYRKTIVCGALPNNNTKSVAHNITNIDNIISLQGWGYGDNAYIPLPYVNTSAISACVMLYATNVNIVLRTGLDRSNTNAYVTLLYTKTTDTATRSIPTENTRKVEEETKDDEPIEEPKEEEKK